MIDDEIVQRGTVDHTPVYPREVAHGALNRGATAVLLVHNHPSGNPAPSEADIRMTKSLKEALEPLGVVVLDHLIVTAEAIPPSALWGCCRPAVRARGAHPPAVVGEGFKPSPTDSGRAALRRRAGRRR